MPQLEFSPEELSAIREEYAKGATDAQFLNFITECRERSLRPGAHVVLQIRNSSEWDPVLKAKVNVKKAIKITTIDAFRLISDRTNLYEGMGEAEFYYLDENNAPSIMSKIPLPDLKNPAFPREPWAACVPIYRKGFREPVRIMARFDAYAITTKRDNEVVLSDQWGRRGPEMLVKCCECISRRVAFPEELGSIYIQEEFDKEDASKVSEAPAAPAVVVPVPKVAVVPVVDHTPAQPTNAARPGHEEEASNGSLSDAINKTLEESLVPRKGDLSDPAYVGETITAEKIVQVVSDVGLHDLNGPVKEVSKRGRKPKTEAVEPEQSESHVIVGGSENTTPIATDDDLPDNMFDDGEPVRKMDNPEPLQDNRLPNKAEGAEIAAKVRSYYVHVANKDLQTYILKTSGKILKTDITAPAQIPQRVWTEVFAKMDTELEKGGKAALVNLVTF